MTYLIPFIANLIFPAQLQLHDIILRRGDPRRDQTITLSKFRACELMDRNAMSVSFSSIAINEPFVRFL